MPAGQMALTDKRLLEAHFEHFSGMLAKWLSGGPLGAHFEHFCGLLAKWLPSCLWRLIWTISTACLPNGSQEASRDSFWELLGPAGKLTPKRPLEAHFEHPSRGPVAGRILCTCFTYSVNPLAGVETDRRGTKKFVSMLMVTGVLKVLVGVV